MAYTFQFRRDTATNWLLRDPILEDGEPGLEINTGQMKVGDGVKKWSQLSYYLPKDKIQELITQASTELSADELAIIVQAVEDASDGPDLVLLYENAKA